MAEDVRSFVSLATMVQSKIILFLRAYFKAMWANPQYKNSICTSEISILGDFPRKQIKFPAIVVSVPSSGNLFNKVIGDKELYSPIYETVEGQKVIKGYSIGGTFNNVVVNIAIASESTAERRNLLDFVSIIMRTVGLQHLRTHNIHISNIALGGAREEYLSNLPDPVYYDTINVTLTTQWVQTVMNIPLIEDIDVIEATVKELSENN